MTVVKLDTLKIGDPRKAINWLIETWGPSGDRWVCKDLSRIEFRKDRDATLFLLHWGN